MRKRADRTQPFDCLCGRQLIPDGGEVCSPCPTCAKVWHWDGDPAIGGWFTDCLPYAEPSRRFSRVVLVGQAPARTGDPRRPLTGRLGRWLMAAAEVDLRAYGRAFERVNLIPEYPGPNACGTGDAFPLAEARRRANELEPRLIGRTVVLIGGGVARAFGFSGEPCSFRFWRQGLYAFVPHPSGRNRWYNHAANEDLVRDFLRRLAHGQLDPLEQASDNANNWRAED